MDDMSPPIAIVKPKKHRRRGKGKAVAPEHEHGPPFWSAISPLSSSSKSCTPPSSKHARLDPASEERARLDPVSEMAIKPGPRVHPFPAVTQSKLPSPYQTAIEPSDHSKGSDRTKGDDHVKGSIGA